MKLLNFCACLLFPFLLTQGCTTGVSVATTGIQAVYNRNQLGQQLTDHYITMQAYRKLFNDTDDFKSANIKVATLNNEVLLVGQVPQSNQVSEAEHVVKSIDGVDKIYNHLIFSAPTSALTHMSDSWITTKIKTKLMATNDIDPDHLKVITENGTVYLMGIVLPYEAEIATEIVQQTQGVQDVVKLFYFMRITKT